MCISLNRKTEANILPFSGTGDGEGEEGEDAEEGESAIVSWVDAPKSNNLRSHSPMPPNSRIIPASSHFTNPRLDIRISYSFRSVSQGMRGGALDG
ncbi:hypothetical protein D3C73_1518810 [compost metagenome]